MRTFFTLSPLCVLRGFEADVRQVAGNNQSTIADAYRRAVGLLTSEEIVGGGKAEKWTREELARAIGVGVASVKRWEKMDRLRLTSWIDP